MGCLNDVSKTWRIACSLGKFLGDYRLVPSIYSLVPSPSSYSQPLKLEYFTPLTALPPEPRIMDIPRIRGLDFSTTISIRDCKHNVTTCKGYWRLDPRAKFVILEID
jgi:hypothetical protein